ncbi:Hypothetical protein, putative [Bodo saltans]|uniref:Ubiquitin-like domain-containing protein n=1 Tax=Bodo saltans TaxID=75058 RepID=A0A0S4IV92_BODSA|nr:Hypothetical protein, putative [Bodo saltans]|eukprot:CUF07892.1 Hypothetical protein, putative [Bodo saltans]
MAHIDIVLVEDNEEVDRVTVRGDADFTELTPFGSLRDIVAQELKIAKSMQFFWLSTNNQPLDIADDVPLGEGGVEHGCTIFVTQRDAVHSERVSTSSSHNTSRSRAPVKSPAVLRLERILSEIEPSKVAKRADELMLKWQTINDVV